MIYARLNWSRGFWGFGLLELPATVNDDDDDTSASAVVAAVVAAGDG